MRRFANSPLFIALWAALLFVPFRDLGSAGILFALLFAVLTLVSVIKKVKPLSCLPVRLRLPDMAGYRNVLLLCIPILFFTFPFFMQNYYLDVLIMFGIYALLAMGLNIIVGTTGLLHLGFVAFYALGAYTYAILNTRFGLGFWTCLPVSAMVSAVAGALLAAPALRLRGDYLAIVTLGFGEIMHITLNNMSRLTNGPNGIIGIGPPSFFGVSLGRPDRYYYLVWAAVLLACVVIRRVTGSRIGLAWLAIRDDEIAASTMGINVMKYKLLACASGSFWAGLAGIFFAAKMRFVSPESFTFMESALVLCMIILGGLGNTYGAIMGAFILVLLPEVLREFQMYRMLVLGVGIVLIMIYRPHGILGGGSESART